MELNHYLLNFYVAQNGEMITPELAKILVSDFAITDGSKRVDGEKWTIEEAKKEGIKAGVNFESISIYDWYLVLNMMYSDYYSVYTQYDLELDFFIKLAISWFNDVDAKENKTFNFFMN